MKKRIVQLACGVFVLGLVFAALLVLPGFAFATGQPEGAEDKYSLSVFAGSAEEQQLSDSSKDQGESQGLAQSSDALASDANSASVCEYCGYVHGSGYVDAEGDGICDIYQYYGRGGEYRGLNNGGIIPRASGTCGGYVDEDGDGVCDYQGTGTCTHPGGGCGWGYTDADANGICDNRDVVYQNGQNAPNGNAGAGRGYGCGAHQRR